MERISHVSSSWPRWPAFAAISTALGATYTAPAIVLSYLGRGRNRLSFAVVKVVVVHARALMLMNDDVTLASDCV